MIDIEKEARLLQNKYVREWRSRNRDKVRQYNQAYWLRKAKKEREDRDAKEND